GYKERGHFVSFLVYHSSDFFYDILSEHGIKVDVVLEKNLIKRISKMRSFIRRGDYDIVQSFLEGPNFICELAGLPFRKWKLVVGERSANPRIRKSLKKIILRMFHFFADKVIANSYATVDIIKSVNPCLRRSKYKVIYNSIDFRIIDSIKVTETTSSDKILLVVVASHQYLKNLSGFVDAFYLLPKNIQHKFKIEWYGAKADGSYQEAIMKIRSYNLSEFFEFFDPTHDILIKMKKASFVGLFSLYEGLPNTICEAMSLGKPVICSDVSDMSIIMDQTSKFLFNPKDPTEIAEVLNKIAHMSQLEYHKVGIQNRIKAVELFDKEKVLDTYLNVFENEINS